MCRYFGRVNVPTVNEMAPVCNHHFEAQAGHVCPRVLLFCVQGSVMYMTLFYYVYTFGNW